MHDEKKKDGRKWENGGKRRGCTGPAVVRCLDFGPGRGEPGAR